MAENGFQFDPRSYPAFADASAKVDRQIELAKGELRVTAWAGDSVSAYAAERFNARDAQAEWRGSSATLAFAQLGNVAAWASRVGANAASMKSSVEQQAEHISKARAAMPKPGETPSLQPDPAAVAATGAGGADRS
ncbi:hypothetical protein DMH04_39660 [Kibdelosporangium aridum]|uniref:Uncharacterized protein n=1 Tax=Kibdelosporangium aridum TaxID=2030 RepID=A0A428YX51_KIBAR|nr:hypothetical protein [Kibdelosporangium aridum]RSM74577.1 hypothetical protein DMH04_39660 [Kibdelosporangium aridum]